MKTKIKIGKNKNKNRTRKHVLHSVLFLTFDCFYTAKKFCYIVNVLENSCVLNEPKIDNL